MKERSCHHLLKCERNYQTKTYISLCGSHPQITDVKDETINLSDSSLEFKGKSEEKDYQVNIEFFKPVDSKGSTYNVLPRSVQMVVMKAKPEDEDSEEEFWPRLLKDKALEKNQVSLLDCCTFYSFYTRNALLSQNLKFFMIIIPLEG